jgi:hypothetical protein
LAKTLLFVTGVATPAKPEADADSIMHPFRTLPDQIDGVVCGQCGHPAWDHCHSDTCEECNSRNPERACKAFTLTGFTAAIAPIISEEYALRA